MRGRSKDWQVLVDPSLRTDERAAMIADVLQGQPSELFCKLLADMIRPNGKGRTPYVLRIARKQGGRPKADGCIDGEMGWLVIDQKLPIDEAVFRVQEKYGKAGSSRSQCLAALRRERKMRAAEETLEKFTKPGLEN
jgi:hypothetical protein